MTYSNIFNAFNPTLLDITDMDLLINASNNAGLLVYGEVHGIKENADIVYTLVHHLKIKRIAVEIDKSVTEFMGLASQGKYDLSLLDKKIFDASILSIEMLKTITTLIKEGVVKEIVCIDTYSGDSTEDPEDDVLSPQKRERELAQNILSLDDSLKTLCIMGQWHTQTKSVTLKSGIIHLSALHRIRLTRPNALFIHIIYREGRLYNAGRMINLPIQPQLPGEYTVIQISQLDYDIVVPNATKISLP